MKKTVSSLCAMLLAAQALLFAPMAMAQVPPHEPGTICFTARFWCWASAPGQPGSRCTCPSPYGPVTGQLG